MAEERNQEIHVKDNRLFNSDGSLRPGMSVEDDVKVAPKIEAKPTPKAEPRPQPAPPSSPKEEIPQDTSGYRGENKIDFHTFILSLASSVQISLGLVAHPMTGQIEQDFAHAQQTIDILGMLEAKTLGNLTPEESGLLKQVLFQLRMAYVEIKKRQP
jgi:hypothetical protein